MLEKTEDDNEEDRDDNNEGDDKDGEEESNNDSAHGEYGIIQRGSKYHSNFRIYIKDTNGVIVSPFHDIPLKRSSANIHSREEVQI